jgi:NAD(P)-dependent dehydrogenase (short-subunit alcohol dehydrogenase family)
MNTLSDYKNRRVIVSGCFSGIGRATAKLLLELGADVHGLDLQHSDLQLRSFNAVDLREPASIDAAPRGDRRRVSWRARRRPISASMVPSYFKTAYSCMVASESLSSMTCTCSCAGSHWSERCSAPDPHRRRLADLVAQTEVAHVAR